VSKVVIVGGGITGLTAAYYLERDTDADIVLLEGSEQIGGKIQTHRMGDFLVEGGADCVFTRKPWALDLICDLGIEHELIEPQQKEFSMLIGGRLHRVPGGLVTLTYSEPDAVEEADFLSGEAKRRVLNEEEAPKGEGEDESIASFFRRRYGQEFSNLVAEPLLAGTHGGDPERLSVRALYSGYFDLERKYGSLAGGMRVRKEAKGEVPHARRPTFISLTNGMRSLIDHLAASLRRTRIVTSAPVTGLASREGGFVVTAGRNYSADQVLLAVPAQIAAPLVRPLSAVAADELAEIQHASSAIVTLAFPRADLPSDLRGTGFLVPYTEKCAITGCTWSSSKWAGRAPDDMALLRVFLGRSLADEVKSAPDSDLVATARGALREILSIGTEPALATVQRWPDALPQYEVGHLDRIARIEAELDAFPGLHLAGTSYRGVGIPDCVRQGRDIARRIAEHR
jgi:oxygen-dependent protoporphyrinogen oxidase